MDLPSKVAHGSSNAYDHYACRCDVCKKGQSDRSREYRTRNRERLKVKRLARYYEDPIKANRATRKRAMRNRAIIGRYKVLKGCFKCGYREHAVSLDLHHRDPATKKYNIAHSVSLSWKSIKEEVRKCDVICRNCHNALHYVDRR